MRRGKNTNKGITLIALIITIIVLLILAGVALASLFGDNGILNNAESAKNKTNLANSKEQVGLAVTSAMTYADALGVVTYNNLVTELNELIGEATITVAGSKSTNVKETVTVTVVYPESAQIGDYVTYNVSYTDMYTSYEFTTSNGWVLKSKCVNSKK